MDGVNADRVSISPSRVTPGGSLSISFVYKANGGYGAPSPTSSGTKSESAGWNSPTLTVEYTEPYTAVSPPASVTLEKGQAAPNEPVTLSWSGARPGRNVTISGYEIYRSDSADGVFALLDRVNPTVSELIVNAPPGIGSYYYRVKALGAVEGYGSALSAVYAQLSVVVTAAGAPVAVQLSAATAYPEAEVILSWSGASPGENNAIIGYDLYRAEAPDGNYEKIASISGTETGGQAAVRAPTSGSFYFKVATRGERVNSAPSTVYAGLHLDASTTSDYCLDQVVVDAGTAFTLTLLSNTAKVHTLTVSMGAFTKTMEHAAGMESLSFTPPLEWLTEMTNRETGEMTVKLATAGGGSITKAMLLRCPDDVGPTVTGALAERVSDTVPAAWGVYVAGKSKAVITLSAAAPAYGAPIQRYAIVGAGISVEGTTLPLTATTELLPPGKTTILVGATDTRGRMGTQTLNLLVEPYDGPEVKAAVTERCDSDGTVNDEGVYGKATATVVISSCGGQNTAVCAVAYRRQGTEEWTNAGNLDDGALIFGDGNIAAPYSYDVRYTVTDALGITAVYLTSVTRVKPEINVKRGGGAWAFGGVANVDGALKVYGDLQVEGIIRGGSLFSYDAQTNTLTISPREGTFYFDEASGTLAITN